MENKSILKNQKGYSLVEVLVGLTLSALMVLGLGKSTVQSLQNRTMNVRNAIAEQIALERLEELTTVNPQTLSEDDSEIEEIEDGPTTYTRTVTITEYDDESREVVVSVSSNNETLGGNATVRATLLSWGD